MGQPSSPPSWRRSLLPTAIAPVVLALVLGTLLGWLTLRTNQAVRWVDHTLDVLRHANALDAQLNTLEAGQRGFLITRDRSFATPMDRARPLATAELSTLHGLVADNPPQQARIEAIRRLQADWIANAEREMRLAADRDPRFLPTFTAGRGARMMEGLRAQLSAFRLEERRLLAEREAQLTGELRLASLTGLAGLGGLVLFLATVGRRHVRLFGRLYARLTEHSLLLDAAHDAILVRDAKTYTITLWNQGAMRLYGWRPDEAIGRRFDELVGVGPPADAPAIAETLARTGRWEGEAIHRDRAGHERLVESRWTYHVELDGRAVVLENNHDVTAQRQAQRELDARREEEARLEIEAYRHADQLKDEFLGAVTHELRTPLNAVLGFGSLLQEETFGPLSPEQHRYLGRMLAMADNLLVLVNDLLDASRLRAGRFSVETAPHPLAPLLTEAIARLEPLAEQRGHTLTLAPLSQLPAVRADAQRVGQVLTNLIGNAIKFTPNGGHITVSARPEPGFVRVAVADTGPGIPPEAQSRLFRPFSQLDADAARRPQGTGLGLSIAKAIVEAHGGAIGVDAAPGQGSTFWFTLPTA